MARLSSVDCPHCGHSMMFDERSISKWVILRTHFHHCAYVPTWRRITGMYFFRLKGI
jgi:DNA-directed RNA polymerase subunit RPC12/RpoP